MPEPLPPPDECANCGAAIPRGAKACPNCGADERTGWRETSVYDGLELPESGYEDEDAARNRPPPNRINGIAWYWWAIALVAILLFVARFVL